MRTWLRLAVRRSLSIALIAWQFWPGEPAIDATGYPPIFLPPEAIATLATASRVAGRSRTTAMRSTFQNRERRLPGRPTRATTASTRSRRLARRTVVRGVS